MTIYEKIAMDRNFAVGVGSALMDILVHESDEFVTDAGLAKGGMTYVDNRVIDETANKAAEKPIMVPGGSACNTMVGIGQLGGQARFVGKTGKGDMGRLLRQDLARQRVEPYLLESDAPTGRVLSIITPDAQRSMLTYLGAAADISPGEITAATFEDAAVVHIEGYLVFSPGLFTSVIARAREAGALISLDLASFTVVKEAKTMLTSVVEKEVDILMANEDEAQAYTGIEEEDAALAALAEKVDIAVFKKGARGSVIAYQGETFPIRPWGDGSAIDTTGAGDLWASGFLFGLIRRMPLEMCGALASRCGHAVCQVVGTNIPEAQWINIRNSMED